VIPDFSGFSILIADDDDASLYLFKEMLEQTNANLYLASNKVELEQKISINNIQVILLDIKFGNVSGFDLLPSIKKKLPKVKVIAQTAYVYPDNSHSYICSGFDGYLTKPIKIEKLFDLLGLLLYKGN
jgi:CheY-like chemotaxis protein